MIIYNPIKDSDNIRKLFKKYSKNILTNKKTCSIIIIVLREWRNRQTRTFEGRVFPTYGFKSRLPHQKSRIILIRLFLSKPQVWYIIECITRLWRDIHSYIISPLGCISSLVRVYFSAVWWDTTLCVDDMQFLWNWWDTTASRWFFKLQRAVIFLKRWCYVEKLFIDVFWTTCHWNITTLPKYKGSFQHSFPNTQKFKQCLCKYPWSELRSK